MSNSITSIKYWTPAEEQYLKDNYHKCNRQQLESYFQCPYDKIRSKARRLGLASKGHPYSLPLSSEPWTDKETEILINNYAYAPKPILQRLLPNRSWIAIQKRGYKLGIHRIAHDLIPLNYRFFEQWNEETAYIIGLLLADGHVDYTPCHDNEDGRYCVFVGVDKRDKDIIQKIANAIEYEGKILYRSNLSFLQIRNRKIVEDVINKGVPPGKKSYFATFPENIPNNLIRHCIRGLIDGDGWSATYVDTKIHKPYYRIGLCGTYELVKKVKELLPEDCSDITISHRSEHCWGWVLTGARAERIAQWIYKDSNIYMDRKYEAAAQYFT